MKKGKNNNNKFKALMYCRFAFEKSFFEVGLVQLVHIMKMVTVCDAKLQRAIYCCMHSFL